jgi:M6 family metalloprotease-like protein
LENSIGRFSWSRAGIVKVFPPPSFRYTNLLAQVDNNGGLADTLYTSNIVYHAMASRQIDFADYDTNGDLVVRPPELTVVLITNDGGGASRGTGFVQPPGVPVGWEGIVAIQDHQGDFLTLCHELAHQLGRHNFISGALDLYGYACLSSHLTLMSCTIVGNDDPSTYHLDPWHKMQYGWCEPRIFSLSPGGLVTIPATQYQQPTAPIILYSPEVGTHEFFILEYRTRTSPVGSGYDENVSDNGLAIWHVQHDAHYEPIAVPAVDQGPILGQPEWRRCLKCQGLHFITDPHSPSFGPCPEGGQHSILIEVPKEESETYRMVLDVVAAPGQHGWRYCSKCQGLSYGPNQPASHCPAGGTHDGSQSGDYSLVVNEANSPGEHDWRWCHKCQGLFFGTNQASSDCPADGLPHDGSQGGDYAVLLDRINYTVWNEGAPDWQRGGNRLFGSNAITPYLRLNNGAPLATYLRVHPFQTGASSITVEWLTEGHTWVDFNYAGVEELGTFDLPFDTFAEGLVQVSRGGTLHIKSGQSTETAHITKPMHIQAYGGPVTIGY